MILCLNNPQYSLHPLRLWQKSYFRVPRDRQRFHGLTQRLNIFQPWRAISKVWWPDVGHFIVAGVSEGLAWHV